MNNEQLMKLDGLVYLREITSGKFENVSKFVEYITTDENGNAYVIYRGTDGYIAWSENAEAATLADTEYQQKALNFFESIPDLTLYNDVQLSGHSKGGNKAMYTTILCDKVVRCVDLDGQGFSSLFINYDEYSNLIISMFTTFKKN